jgi:formate-dependent nitrite reductase cytochrome c552 subunit
MTRAALLLALLGLAGWTGPALAQGPKAPAAQPRPAPAPHTGELDCRQCHEGSHQGVVRMYLGLGGRGTPMIPSHMFQVRVQCVACHIVPKVDEGSAALVGQTFRPTEQACVNCHGEKYRGMLQRWVDTLGRMREMVGPKLAAARAALTDPGARAPKQTRARELTNDANYNLQFVALGKGVHNVFYAADLLKLSNGWLDQALALLGKPPVKSDDALVRGGYCAVLCHEPAGVKQRETVTFRKQTVPHVRHVTEFGATCTACHSAEVHKAVTATPATCGGCHHSAQNERCESCHRAQSAFYRGQVSTALAKIEPNVMVNAVGCAGCHDWSKKHSRQAVAEKCVGCHDAAYTSFMGEWTTGLDKEVVRAADGVKRAEVALARARRAGRRVPEAQALLAEARQALDLVRRARPAHNPPGAESLLEVSRKKAESALAALAGR